MPSFSFTEESICVKQILKHILKHTCNGCSSSNMPCYSHNLHHYIICCACTESDYFDMLIGIFILMFDFSRFIQSN